MKQLVKFEFNPDGRWARLSGVLMGIALFVRAVDYLGLRGPGSVGLFRLLVALILPLAVEDAWCICLRLIRLRRAEVYGIFGAVSCLLMLLQTFFYGNVLLTLLFIVLLLVAGAAMVMIPWGLLSRRSLGFLILLAVALSRMFVVVLRQLVEGFDWMEFLSDLPSFCVLLALSLFFCDLKAAENA